MPVWAIVVLAVVATLLGVAVLALGGVFGWRALVRRTLIQLVGRGEAIEALAQALVDTVGRLAHGEDEALAEFADDPESTERRALHEMTTRAHILTYELDTMPLPRALYQVAESMADAAAVIEREASHVQDPVTGHAALDALSGIDLEAVREYAKVARDRLNDACVARGLDDIAVYGGGLYL